MSDATGSTGPRWTVAAVARRLGVAPATLRTWDRRYGVGPSAHAAGAHRRYTAADVARLERMREGILHGLTPSEAARIALDVTARPADGHRPGGRVLALPGGTAQQRGLARAAAALDATAVTEAVSEAVAALGVVGAWDAVVRPVLVAAGLRWEMTGEGVEVEHLLSESVTAVLHAAVAAAPAPRRDVRPALLACAENDLHALPLQALRAALAEGGVAARVLGAATPTDALAAAVRRLNPSSVLVWAQLPATARAEDLRRVPSQRPPVVVIAGGPGWDGIALPPRVGRPASLGDAVALARAAAGIGAASA